MDNEKRTKGTKQLICNFCYYNTHFKQTFERHIKTKRHMDNVQKKKELKGTKGTKKHDEYLGNIEIETFQCELCNFTTYQNY